MSLLVRQHRLPVDHLSLGAQENVVASQTRKNRTTAGKGPRAQGRRKKEIELGYGSLEDECTIRKIIHWGFLILEAEEEKITEN